MKNLKRINGFYLAFAVLVAANAGALALLLHRLQPPGPRRELGRAPPRGGGADAGDP